MSVSGPSTAAIKNYKCPNCEEPIEKGESYKLDEFSRPVHDFACSEHIRTGPNPCPNPRLPCTCGFSKVFWDRVRKGA